MTEYTIREYREQDLPALVVHWKESVKGWPPGFNPGVTDWTPEAVRDWLLRSSYIAVWLGWLNDTIVGFLKYSKYWGDPEVTFVDLFNAHPDYHGKGYGRRLLVLAVDKAIQDRAKRVDLYTWPANREAVPLYKKCGFFWRPGISHVQMYNFLPAVLNNPLVKDFLGETHWYDAMRQPLEIKEDDEKIDGCSYHKYTFEKNGGTMEVLVDPSTSGITGIISDDLTIRCDVPGETHVAGFPSPVKWLFRSGRKKPVRVEVDCSSADELGYCFSKDFDLKGEVALDTIVTPRPETQPEHIDWYGKPIECRIKVDGTEFLMKPGVRAVPPFQVETHPYPVRLVPGEERTVVVNLRSRIRDKADFLPEFTCIGNLEFAQGPDGDAVSVSDEDSFGASLALRASNAEGAGAVEIGGRLTVNGLETRIHPIRIHAGIAPAGKPIEVRDDNPLIKSVSNGVISARAERFGGKVRISLYETGRELLTISREELGEPFSWEFETKKYDIEIKTDEHRADIICRAESSDFPGIGIERHVEIGSGCEVAAYLVVRNSGSQVYTGRVRMKPAIAELGGIVLPLGDCLVCGSTDPWGGPNPSIPIDPSRYPEPWVAWLSSSSPAGESRVLGVIYEGLSNVRWTRYPGATFEFSIRDLAPGETLTLPRQRFLINAASWQDVQKAALKNEPSGLPTHPREIVHAETPMFSDAPSAGFRFRRMIAVPIEGKASLKFPGGECVEAAVEKWTLDAPIEIGMPDLPEHVRGLQAVEYRMWSDRMERSGRLPLFVPVRGSSVQITQSHEGEYDYFRVRNGCIDFRVAPKFNGVLYWLSEETNPETNLLKTPFPKPGMWTWINPWFGGIGIAPSLGFRFHHSSFDGDAIKLEWNGYKWEGVRVKIKPVKQWQSLEIESLYLTRPGVPVIVNLVRLTENGGCRRSFNVECVSFACPSGDPDAKTEAIIDEWGSRVKLERSERGSESGENPWMAVYDPATRKTFGAAISRGGVYAWEAAEAGIPIWGSTRVTTCPGKTVEFAILYAIADDPELIPILAEPVRHWDRIIAG